MPRISLVHRIQLKVVKPPRHQGQGGVPTRPGTQGIPDQEMRGVELSRGRTVTIKSYSVLGKQPESLVSVGSRHKFSLGSWSDSSTARPPRPHGEQVPSSVHEGSDRKVKVIFCLRGADSARALHPGGRGAPIQSRPPPQPSKEHTPFPQGKETPASPPTLTLLCFVCFCFAVMPLTWDGPVCVFVHRIFIFIQFSLFENARSMMHLTDY